MAKFSKTNLQNDRRRTISAIIIVISSEEEESETDDAGGEGTKPSNSNDYVSMKEGKRHGPKGNVGQTSKKFKMETDEQRSHKKRSADTDGIAVTPAKSSRSEKNSLELKGKVTSVLKERSGNVETKSKLDGNNNQEKNSETPKQAKLEFQRNAVNAAAEATLDDDSVEAEIARIFGDEEPSTFNKTNWARDDNTSSEITKETGAKSKRKADGKHNRTTYKPVRSQSACGQLGKSVKETSVKSLASAGGEAQRLRPLSFSEWLGESARETKAKTSPGEATEPSCTVHKETVAGLISRRRRSVAECLGKETSKINLDGKNRSEAKQRPETSHTAHNADSSNVRRHSDPEYVGKSGKETTNPGGEAKKLEHSRTIYKKNELGSLLVRRPSVSDKSSVSSANDTNSKTSLNVRRSSVSSSLGKSADDSLGKTYTIPKKNCGETNRPEDSHTVHKPAAAHVRRHSVSYEHIPKAGPSSKTLPDKNPQKLRRASEQDKAVGSEDEPGPSSRRSTKQSFSMKKYSVSPATAKRCKQNSRWLKLITELFLGVYKSTAVNILSPKHKAKLDLFFDTLNEKYQYVCLRLFAEQRKWCNVYKFCELIHVDMERLEVFTMYNSLKKCGVFTTNYRDEGVISLLQQLELHDIRSLCDTFKVKKTTRRIRAKCNETLKQTPSSKQNTNNQPSAPGGKKTMINNLLEICSTKSKLSSKSNEQLLMEEIECIMGHSVMLSKDFYDTLDMTYVLATFANPDFVRISEYTRRMLVDQVVFPEKPVHEYAVFYSCKEFSRYITAHQYRHELEKVREKKPFNHVEYLKLCESAFNRLKSLENVEQHDPGRFKDAPHLIRFTAKAIYVSALSRGAKALAPKYPTETKCWLEYMLDKVDFPHRFGDWCYELSYIYMELKEFNSAAKLLIDVLKRKRRHLSDVQRHQLAGRAQKLFTSKLRIKQCYHDTIVSLLPTPVDEQEIPTINAVATQSIQSGQKRKRVVQDTSVEESQALQYYCGECGYTEGKCCEGELVLAMFALLFWDVIYDSHQHIPGTFISKIQNQPLDLTTRHFYLNRKEAIDRRLKEISREWSQAKVVAFLKDNYTKHSHEESFCGEVGKRIENTKMLCELLDCVGKRVLSKIFRRLVQDIRLYKTGMPELLMWNPATKKSKFVKVQGQKNVLSIEQTLWLKHLKDSGADVEIYHLRSTETKKKPLKIAKA